MSESYFRYIYSNNFLYLFKMRRFVWFLKYFLPNILTICFAIGLIKTFTFENILLSSLNEYSFFFLNYCIYYVVTFILSFWFVVHFIQFIVVVYCMLHRNWPRSLCYRKIPVGTNSDVRCIKYRKPIILLSIFKCWNQIGCSYTRRR